MMCVFCSLVLPVVNRNYKKRQRCFAAADHLYGRMGLNLAWYADRICLTSSSVYFSYWSTDEELNGHVAHRFIDGQLGHSKFVILV
jgi:hypothetical protein